ncbi:TenA family transcriptional regulator [Pseudomonas fragi]|uniref:iron-containing redox enzyme family protein n=1 Tax=Pseudomonas fragi TaxID=296 RepID=UPI0013311410|nr:TenA family transcriptional regulator [Pseudomonas fragi]
MSEVFDRTGPLMEETSYPQWAQQLIRDCSESKRRAVKHEIYKRMRDNTLSPRAMRMFLVGGWPVVEQFSLYMGHNLGKTRYGRHPGEDMARRWLIRNIRVELNHADYWVNWARAHGVSLEDLNAQDLPAEFQALNDWCWHSCSKDSLAVAMAATNYAIEGAVGEWAAIVCSTDIYEESFAVDERKRAMKWLKMHAQYDDEHPWEALEIVCTLVGMSPSQAQITELRKAICKSYDYMYLFLQSCLLFDKAAVVREHRELVES